MKRFLNIIIGLTLFLSLALPGYAEFAVVPAEPFNRQFNMTIEPGQSMKASIIVKNLANSPLTVKMYGADATHSNQGTFALTTLSNEQKHIGTWVKFDEPTQSIAPKEEKTISFSVNVPKGVTPGNYGGGIAVEASSADLNNVQDTTKKAVTVSARIFVKLFVDIPGDKRFDYAWDHFEFEGNDGLNGRPHFIYSFENKGNTIILIEPKIKLKGFPPLKNSELTFPVATLQPGTKLEHIDHRWDEPPPFGFFIAEASTTFSEFDIATNTKINSVTITKSVTIDLTPRYITVILLTVIGAVIAFFLIRFFRMKWLKMRSKKYTVKESETITDIASSNGVNWKLLTKLNKLRPPYTLRKGQIILIPPGKK